MPGDLNPLPYHVAVASRLETLEPTAWAVFAGAASSGHPGEPVDDRDVDDPVDASDDRGSEDDLRQQLLRHAYRMEPEAHPRVHEAAVRAAEAIGIDVPVTLYQLEGSQTANAGLIFRPNEAVLALSGNLLALLSDDELVACFGHELAHHKLWTMDGGRFLAADRLLDALALDAATPAFYLETARRFDLATELYADRGSLAAAGSLDVAVSSLIKVVTGLTDVDPQAYLRQAEAARPDKGTEGTSHPETVLRAWALSRWLAGEGESSTGALLAPSLDIERLDLLDRERLEAFTRRLVLDVLAPSWIRTDAVTGHARQFLVDVVPSPAAGRGKNGRSASGGPAVTAPVQTRLPADASKETRRFLSYVLLDLSTVDPELDDEALVESLAVAREAGFVDTFEEIAKRELSINARAWEIVRKQSAGRRVPLATDGSTMEILP